MTDSTQIQSSMHRRRKQHQPACIHMEQGWAVCMQADRPQIHVNEQIEGDMNTQTQTN